MEKLNSINEALPSPTFAQDPPIATEEQPDYDDDGGNDMADIDNSDWDWGEPDPDYDEEDFVPPEDYDDYYYYDPDCEYEDSTGEEAGYDAEEDSDYDPDEEAYPDDDEYDGPEYLNW